MQKRNHFETYSEEQDLLRVYEKISLKYLF